MAKPIKNLRAAQSVTPDPKGQWLVLIGDSGETSADDIESFFADIWPDVEPEATIDAIAASPGSSPPSAGPDRCAHHQMRPDVCPPLGCLIN
jgi:hypothetical protein